MSYFILGRRFRCEIKRNKIFLRLVFWKVLVRLKAIRWGGVSLLLSRTLPPLFLVPQSIKNYSIPIWISILERRPYEVTLRTISSILRSSPLASSCFIHQIKDTSRGGSYHNKRFKAEAEQRGLQIDYDSRIGWSITSPTEDLLNFCIENGLTDILIARNDLIGFNPAITRGKGTASTTRRSSYRKHICPGCLSTARTTKDMKLICGECNEVMIMTD